MADLSIIKDLRTIYKNIGEKEVTIELETGNIDVKVKKYLPYEDKRVIIESTVEAGMDVDVKTVLAKLDRGSMRIVKEYLLIKMYTDIPVLEDILETYNLFTASGLKELIFEHIDEKELREINVGIEDLIDEFYRIQDISNMTGYKLEDIIKGINGDFANTIDGIKDLKFDEIVAKQKVLNKQNSKIEKLEKQTK